MATNPAGTLLVVHPSVTAVASRPTVPAEAGALDVTTEGTSFVPPHCLK